MWDMDMKWIDRTLLAECSMNANGLWVVYGWGMDSGDREVIDEVWMGSV